MSRDALEQITLDLMIDHIARGHAFTKHVMGEDPKQKMTGLNAFTKEHDNNGNELGPDLGVKTVLDLRHYLERMIDDEHTVGFVRSNNGAVILFNTRDRVIAHFTPNDKQHDYGSVYRYDTSPSDYKTMHNNELFDPPPNRRHMYRVMNNWLYPGSVRASLEDLVEGMRSEPLKYTAKPTTRLTEARFLIALGNENRPGRKDVQGARNNGILHSPTYAEKNHRNMFGPDSIAREDIEAEICELDSFDEEFETVELLKQRGLGAPETDAYDSPGMM